MSDVRNYAVVTGAYWGFTLTDGALRMLVLLHFHQLGYSPFQLASLFVLYEVMGIVTNLLGGWMGSRFGLKLTLYLGLSLQIAALLALSVLDPAWPEMISVLYVFFVQGLSGVAKDFSKMSSKTAIKFVVAQEEHGQLFKWVALLTGSKNALKGVGFFLGGFLLTVLGFTSSLWIMAVGLAVLLAVSLVFLPRDMGQAKASAKFSKLFSKSTAINRLSAARVFLFGARDVWFVVGLPVFLHAGLGWSFTQVGTFMAAWVIGYGFIQGLAPRFVTRSPDGRSAETRAARYWVVVLCGVTAGLGIVLSHFGASSLILIVGLGLFGLVFAINSSLHSYLILAFSDGKAVAMDVGFYYMANAAGRLGGTLLSGVAYSQAGLVGCLLTAAALLAMASAVTYLIPAETTPAASTI